MKKSFVFVIFITVFAILITGFANAADTNDVAGNCGDNGAEVIWSFNTESGKLTISGTGNAKDWSKLAVSGSTAAPWREYADKILTAEVTGISKLGAYSFANLKNLTTVSISDSVTVIPTGAFLNCEKLSRFVIPQFCTEIRESAFSGCSALAEILIPSSTVKIGKEAFEGCGGIVKLVVANGNSVYRSESDCLIENSTSTLIRGTSGGIIPNNISTIAAGAFSGCTEMKNVTVPDTILKMGYGAFSGCTGLTSMSLPFVGDCRVYADGSVDSDAAHDRDKINGRLAYLFGDTEIPASLREISLTDCETVETEAFAGCSGITAVRLPSCLRLIKDGAFYGCSSLVSLEIPSGVLSVGIASFASCASLERITVPDSTKSVGDSAFSGCSALKNVKIGSGVTELGNGLFSGCSSLEALAVEEGNSVYYSKGNCIIEKSTMTVLAGCRNSVLPDDILIIGSGAFRNCNALTSITFPLCLRKIESYAFESCVSLKVLEFPPSLTYIGDKAFAECSGIETVKAHEGIIYGNSVFRNCISMKSEGMAQNDSSVKSDGCGSIVLWQITALFIACSVCSTVIVGKNFKY